MDAYAFSDWNYEEAVAELARDMGTTCQRLEAQLAHVLGVSQVGHGRKRGRPPNAR